MSSSFARITIHTLLVCFAFTLGALLVGRRVEAAPKRVYRSDVTVPNSVQRVLDQRASEGWRLITMSEGNQDGAVYLVLVFERE